MTALESLSRLAVVFDGTDDAAHTHSALAAHDPTAGRVTLHPGPGTTSDTALAHDLLAALGKPPQLSGRFPAGRQPVWEAATAWVHALPVTRLTVLRAHRLTDRRLRALLQLWDNTGIHLTLVVHRPRLTAALHRSLASVPHTCAAGRRGSGSARPAAAPSTPAMPGASQWPRAARARSAAQARTAGSRPRRNGRSRLRRPPRPTGSWPACATRSRPRWGCQIQVPSSDLWAEGGLANGG